MIDLHFHLLPGIDDGPTDLAASVALARAAAEAGVETIVATPHVSTAWRNSPRTIAEGVRLVQARLAELSIPVRVRPGAEIALTYALDLSDRELRALSLGGGPWLLIELPQASAVVGLEAQLKHLQDRGHGIVIAHVERCPSFAHDSELLGRLVEAGMIASLTAGALVGRFGAPLQRFAQRLVARGLVHNVASDAHDCALRAPGLRHELAAANLREQTAWLTQDVPAAILAGRPIPPMPPNWPAAPSRSQLLGRLLTTRH